MLKPLAKKKAMALPPPHAYLEEWQAHASAAGHIVGVGGSGGHSFSLLSLNALHPPAAALRIQLRYRKYQQKVRALLTRSDKGSGDAPPPGDDALTSATGSVKAALRERGVAGSSMALAIAYSARKESVHDSESASQRTLPLVRQSTTSSLQRSYTAEMRASRKEEPPTKWPTTEWTAPATATVGTLHDVHESDARANDTSVGSPSDVEASGANGLAVATTAAAPKDEVDEAVDADALDAPPLSAREHGFVDIMHHSWLLASMEERCADAAASIGATSRTGRTQALQVADFRHTVLDLVFIARSGVGHNLHGRAPSAVAVHHRNLVTRVRHALDHSSEAAGWSAADEQRVSRIFRGLQSDMIMPAVRTLGWLLTKTWRLLFHGVHVDVASLHRVLACVADAQRESDVSVVFAPTHKSHLDYLIISYLCFAYGIPLPRIAAGNNLDLPLLGPFLRANGSFFIRRSFRDDVLYKHVLQSYVHELMSDGNPIEVFVEGGRSRHGRVCKPRLGFLSMFHEYTKLPVHSTTSSGRKKSVLLVPISLDYDKVYEVEGYAAQLLGKPKEKESIGGFLKSVWDIVFLRCGHSYVRFGAPLALTAESALDDMARELAVRMQTCGTVTSTSIVSALLMWKRRYQTREMLQTRVHWLVAELSTRAVHVTHVADDAIADHALSILNVVVHANGVLAPQLEVPARALEVGFYRNHLLHVFLPDMAVAGAIDALLRDTVATECGGTSVCIGLAALEEKTLMVWNFLRHICRHDTTDIVARIRAFVRTQSPACRVEDDVVVVDLACWKASKLVGFALSLLWPFVDSLWLCSQGLWSLLGTDAVVDTSGSSTASQAACTEHTERAVVQRVQTLARELFQQRILAHAEAFCSESVKQSLDFLVERGLIEYVDTRDDRSRVIAFCNADAREAPGIVQALVDEVNGWRRPESRLWRPRAVAPANLSREVALSLMLRSTGSLSLSPVV